MELSETITILNIKVYERPFSLDFNVIDTPLHHARRTEKAVPAILSSHSDPGISDEVKQRKFILN